VYRATGVAGLRFVEGIRGVQRQDLPREILDGITLAALVIPLNIGYAQVAGLPPIIGLYAGIAPADGSIPAAQSRTRRPIRAAGQVFGSGF
jgi:hypothetical protein